MVNQVEWARSWLRGRKRNTSTADRVWVTAIDYYAASREISEGRGRPCCWFHINLQGLWVEDKVKEFWKAYKKLFKEGEVASLIKREINVKAYLLWAINVDIKDIDFEEGSNDSRINRVSKINFCR